jgi:hypothetical protein
MCEPAVIHGGDFKGVTFHGTGLSVSEHQRRTVDNFLELRDLAPELPWIPVLQGYRPSEYLDCAALYERAGVDLSAEKTVGIGSVCRREATSEAFDIFAEVALLKVRAHGFGLKKGFMKLAFGHGLASCDSMAWSFNARCAARSGRVMEGCTHKSCANCRVWAEAWRDSVISIGHRPKQLLLTMGCED